MKAHYVEKFRDNAPFTHNLLRLAELVKIELPEEKLDWIDKITSFNLNVRYDDYKQDFYKKCTKGFAKHWIERITILRKWIKQEL